MKHIDSNRPAWIALRIAGIYAVIGGLWILLSDTAVESLVQNAETMTRVQMYKGWFYVLVTALLLFFLIQHRMERSLQHQKNLLQKEQFLHSVMMSLPLAVQGYNEDRREKGVQKTGP